VDIRIFAALLVSIVIALIVVTGNSADKVDPPDPPEVAYVDEHEDELIEKLSWEMLKRQKH
jgi:hypothetical protein